LDEHSELQGNVVLTFKKTATLWRVLVTSILLFASSATFGQSENAALVMVKTMRLGENLSGMTYQTALNTTTYRGVATKLGPSKANELLIAAVKTIAPKHQEQWNKNLAQSWEPNLTPEEIQSLLTEKQRSPYANKFMSLQNKVGDAMKAKSEPLLIEVVKEVLLDVFEKSLLPQ
jgi:hypothetical protein